MGVALMDHFIDAVTRGQPTVIFEAPLPFLASKVPATSAHRRAPGTNPMFAKALPPPKGDIAKLWRLLGIGFSRDEIVWQDYNPYPALAHLPGEFVFVDTGSGAKEPFNPNDVISAGVQHMLFPFPGFLSKRPASKLEFTRLVQTGNVTGTVSYDEAMPKGSSGLQGENSVTHNANAKQTLTLR